MWHFNNYYHYQFRFPLINISNITTNNEESRSNSRRTFPPFPQLLELEVIEKHNILPHFEWRLGVYLLFHSLCLVSCPLLVSPLHCHLNSSPWHNIDVVRVLCEWTTNNSKRRAARPKGPSRAAGVVYEGKAESEHAEYSHFSWASHKHILITVEWMHVWMGSGRRRSVGA